jgi:hypothetical protein
MLKRFLLVLAIVLPVAVLITLAISYHEDDFTLFLGQGIGPRTVLHRHLSPLRGKHNYELSVFGPLSAGNQKGWLWTSDAINAFSSKEPFTTISAERACDVALKLSGGNLVGIGRRTEDGAAYDMQEFPPVELRDDEMYILIDRTHRAGARCTFRLLGDTAEFTNIGHDNVR